MKEYEAVAQNTRNLEQEYISQIIDKYSNRIGKLQKQIETMRDQHAAALEEVRTARDLREQVNRLEMQRSMDEQKLLEYECAMAGLKQSLAESNEQKRTVTDNVVVPRSEGIEELRSIQEEVLKGLKQLASSTERRISNLEDRTSRLAAGQDSTEIIKKLKSEIEALQDRNEFLQSSVKQLEEQKDSIVLLKDSIESKDKIIESQRQQIQKLNEKLKKESVLHDTLNFGSHLADPFNEKENVEPWALVMPKSEPAPKKKKETKRSGNKGNGKIVNVGNIIREENKSFFNNLSFNNSSSPVHEKKVKKKL